QRELACSTDFPPEPGLEAFAHHLFALGPERFGVLWIERVGSDAGTYRTDQPFGDLRHLAILAIATAYLLRWRHERGPDRRRGPLRDRLPLEGRRAGGCQLCID